MDRTEERLEQRVEQRLRAARPAVPPLPHDFATNVVAEIERRGLAVRPLWRVRGLLWLGRAAAAVALLAATLALNAAAYELRASGKLELLYFGARLLDGFLSGLPYDLLAGTLLLGGAAAWLLRHTRAARVPVAWAVLISYGMTGTGGLALAASGVNEALQEAVLEAPAAEEEPAAPGWLPGMAWFYGERAVYHRPHPRFRMGRVLERTEQGVRLQTPLGEELEVPLPRGFRAEPGDHVRLIVAAAEGTPRVEQAQLCNPQAVQHYFHRQQMMMRHRGMMGPGMGPGMHEGRMGPGMMGPGTGRGMGPGMGPHMMGPGMGPGTGGSPQR